MKPSFKIDIKWSRIMLCRKTALRLGINAGDNIMFKFNINNGIASIGNDGEPEGIEDSLYRFKESKSTEWLYLTSKHLIEFFIDTFDLLNNNNNIVYFNISEMSDSKGYYNIALMEGEFIKAN